MWATIGHLACQRVFGICDVAGEPGAETTPFTNAAYNCPGDDDLENFLDAAKLVEALESTFALVERVLATWTLDDLAVEIRHPEWEGDWNETRGFTLSRMYAHDVHHCGEVNEILSVAGLELIDLWN